MDAAEERFRVQRDHFERVLARLEQVLLRPEDDVVRDAMIQRFEFTFETAWKALYRLLRARGNDIDEEAYQVIPAAFARRLIIDQAGWGDMRKYRNLTSHTYDEKVAVEVAAFIRSQAVDLFRALAVELRKATA
jgi:nucleotidyltransferase substrate binding protein (TIGR01987 family)